MTLFKNIFKIILILLLVLVSCSKDDDLAEVNNNDNSDNNSDNSGLDIADWSIETHSNDVDPNYAEVYDDNNSVRRIDLVFDPKDWELMLEDMSGLYGTFGQGGGGPGGGGGGFADENPIFRPAKVFYNGVEWYKVGARFKGNSSLSFSWRNGVWKMSFKLDFDEFEDEFPEIENQRFYGFKQLSLKNNFDDESQLREKVASDIFRESGIPSPRTQFYEVFVDHGSGPVYFGLYTMVEEPDDSLIKSQFSNNDGNLYKPDGNGATFSNGSFNQNHFIKQTNENEADWTDIQSIFSILHSENRNTNPEEWRNNLESVFNVEGFLNYLAVNTVIQNWDTYGRMTHNYYLYGNPDNDYKLTWIPWDNNESLRLGKMGGSLPLNFNGVGNNWPLIRYLYNDPVYRGVYDEYVSSVIVGAFETSHIQSVYSQYSNLIESSVINELEGYTFLETPGDFQAAVSILNNHAQNRSNAVNNYLN